ncbi:site-specific integrase [Nostocoides veronense]
MGAVARYPEDRMMFPPAYAHDIPEAWQRFFDLREELLLDYGYNTARAYWGDLQDWFEWAVEREKDVLNLSEKDAKQYCALLRRRGYSESAIRRRRVPLARLDRLYSQNQNKKTQESEIPCPSSEQPQQFSLGMQPTWESTSSKSP